MDTFASFSSLGFENWQCPSQMRALQWEGICLLLEEGLPSKQSSFDSFFFAGIGRNSFLEE